VRQDNETANRSQKYHHSYDEVEIHVRSPPLYVFPAAMNFGHNLTAGGQAFFSFIIMP
jgi:hypothetical protein